FAVIACSDFRACMEQAESSYWICKPKVCSKIRKTKRHFRCFDFLFHCK
ncbi:hypothetical protein Y032_0771g2218, partial [Ancylostoma ceylanicum]